MRIRALLVVLCALLVVPRAAHAQSPDELMEEGILAFRDGRYDDAVGVLERVAREDPDRGEAHFLLARIYTETPLADEDRAEAALDRALKLEPENVTYLVGRLRQLRKESWNFFQERIREQKRIALARDILELDSTNAFAHEELGASFIRDFWRYRNAIMLPTMSFSGSSFRAGGPMALGEAPRGQSSLPGEDDDVTNVTDPLSELGPRQDTQMEFFDPETVFPADRFDIGKLERMGIPVNQLAARAQRAYDRAIGHLTTALETDPRRRTVYEYLMEIYALKGEYGEAQSMLEDMYTFYAEDPLTWLYMGLTQYRSGHLQGAANAFETAFRYMDEADRAAFEELDYLLPREERSQYREDPVSYASRFWTSKDPRYLTPFNERKLEHYARLVYADLLYGSDDLGLRGWSTERGRILVRYGPPDRDVVIVPGSTSRIDDLGLAPRSGSGAASADRTPADMNFSPRSGHAGAGFDMGAEANTFNIWDYGDFRFVFEDPFRNGEYRLYTPSASDVSGGVPPWMNDYSIRARETFARIPERYDYEAPGRQVEIPFLVSSFKGEGGADLYVHYGIPISEEGAREETINISAQVGAFLVSGRRDLLVERRRTIYGLRGERVRSFEEAHLWVDSEEMAAPAGRHEVSMEFETAGGGTVAVQRREVDVPDYEAERLQLSDVMLAYAVEEVYGGESGSGSVQRDGLSIAPAPWSVFSHGQPIYLFFEVYHLARNAENLTHYEIDAQLLPRDESGPIGRFVKNLFGGAEGVSVSLPGSGTQSDEGHYLIMDASNQEPGLYTLTLRVRDTVAGSSVERAVDLFLE
ncbi:MAG: GWxTD domain-containing protein [Rhodothermales bacterium]